MSSDDSEVSTFAEGVSDLMRTVAGGLFVLLGIFGLLSTSFALLAGGSGQWLGYVIALLFSLSFIGIGLVLIPHVHYWLANDHAISTFGRVRSVDHRAFRDEGTERCVECDEHRNAGIVTRYRDQLVIAGWPVRTYATGSNVTCADCVDREQSTSTTTDRNLDKETAE